MRITFQTVSRQDVCEILIDRWKEANHNRRCCFCIRLLRMMLGTSSSENHLMYETKHF